MVRDTDWIETYFEVVTWINDQLNKEGSLPHRQECHKGRGGLYELAEELTDEFQKDYGEIKWSEVVEYYDALEIFLNDKNDEE